MKKKIASGVVILILAAGIYFLLQPAVYVQNEADRDRPGKVYPFRDSVLVFIPYKLTVHNNRWQSQKLERILDENFLSSFDNLLYNKGNTAIGHFYDPFYKDLPNDYFATKYRNTIFPFCQRTFYYFREHRLSQKELDIDITPYSPEQIKVQLKDLSENLPIQWQTKLIDSLYSKDEGKRFNLYFGDGSLGIKLRAKTNQPEQRLLNPRDSVRGLSKKEVKAWLLEYVMRPANEELEEF